MLKNINPNKKVIHQRVLKDSMNKMALIQTWKYM